MNTFTGFMVNWTVGFLIYPMFSMNPNFQSLTGITMCFTALSIARNYLIRRISEDHQQSLESENQNVEEVVLEQTPPPLPTRKRWTKRDLFKKDYHEH